MEQERHNFKITQHGRLDSVLNTTMDRAISITRDRARNRRTEVVLSAECPDGSGHYIALGTYMYLPDKGDDRDLLVIPKTPKHPVL